MNQTITTTQQTHFKRSTKQAVELPASEKISVIGGQIFDIGWFKREKDHVLFELKSPTDGIFNWYAYAQHVQVSKNGSVQEFETSEESEESGIDHDTMQLSEHFKLWEFVTSQTAARHGIDNTPPTEVISRLSTLCQHILEPARQVVGPLRISSGYRCPALNRAVGGSKTSAHMQGYAADVIPLSTSKLELASWIKSNCKFDQIILEYGTPSNPSWIHVSCDSRGRRQVFRIP